MWFGPTGRLAVSDPDLIREIFSSKSEFYEKNEAHPLIKQLEGDGLLSLKGEKWAHHRKIITPTFHMENLKVSIVTYTIVINSISLSIIIYFVLFVPTICLKDKKPFFFFFLCVW